MAKKPKLKHIMLRKFMAVIMLTCFVVYVLGQSAEGVSASSMLTWSSILMIGIGIGFQVLLKVWSVWEDVADKPSKQNSK